MEKALLIAEKPSLMREIEAVYKKHKGKLSYSIVFKSQRGHLVTLKLPSEIDEEQKEWGWDKLPFHPEDHGGWQYKVIQEKRVGSNPTAYERFNDIKKELASGDYDFVINAGDPDQEGELLIRTVLEKAGNKLPIKRFWTNDLTENAVLTALQDLKEDDTDSFFINLYAAAKARQHSDYRLGMNGSQAATLKMGGRVAVGRVKTPIQAIICKREEEIRNFKPHTVYGVVSNYSEGFTGSLFDVSSENSEKETDEDKKNGVIWFETKKEAEDLIASLSKTGTVVSFDKKRTETFAPKLYKLATLQIDAGKIGYNDAKTLEIIQGLYEKKLLSYPRTDCEYVSSKENFNAIVKSAMAVTDLIPYIRTITQEAVDKVRATKKWVNDAALKDAGHSAIIPTSNKPDFSALSKAEQDIYTLVCKRLVAIFMPPLVQEKTKLVADIDGHTFKSNGKTLVDAGYTKIFGTKFADMVIPPHKAGDVLNIETFDVSEKTSTCPKRYTSPDIIAVCENPAKFLDDPALKSLGKRLKIGTPATRSAIIRRLIDKDKYLAEKKEKNTVYIVPTPNGETIINNLGSCELCKVDLTGIWEEKLEDIRQGKMSLDAFDNEMKTNVEDLIDYIKGLTVKTVTSGGRKSYTVIGTCPKCGKELIESEKGYSCRGYKDGCQTKLWKQKWGATFSKDDFLTLIENKTIKKPITIAGETKMREMTYDWTTFDIIPVGTTWSVAAKTSAGNDVEESDSFYRCLKENWQINKVICGAEITPEDLNTLFSGKQIVKNMSKEKEDGTLSNWEQALTWDKQKNRIEFVQNHGEETKDKCPCCTKAKLCIRPYTSKDGNKETMLSCPKCGFKIWATSGAYRFTDEDKEGLIKNKTTEVHDFVSSGGKEYRARFVVNKKEKQVVREFVDL